MGGRSCDQKSKLGKMGRASENARTKCRDDWRILRQMKKDFKVNLPDETARSRRLPTFAGLLASVFIDLNPRSESGSRRNSKDDPNSSISQDQYFRLVILDR